ncbi:hypothetical protein [Lysobacter sp. N42]|uniref:hypothetical protein n=1 Tax=Lysobacter sp. N42 TaxID=2545719 RepID=UPI0010437DE5|nr:hypothetical protein [Lysobacter sp. N42]TCZ78324.1 hypothetical protein EYQ95_25755 [Lysobacter sp. N42]
MKRLVAVIALFAITTSAHAGKMLEGAMYRTTDGHKLEFAIEKSRGTGKMTAVDPASGETFEGQYSGQFTGQGSYSGTFGGERFQANSRPTGAVAEGVLVGNMGTVIEINLSIKPGWRPTGFGSGQDNKGVAYRVVF